MSILLLIDAITFPDWLGSEIFSIGPITLQWYGLSYVIGLFGAYWYAARMAARPEIWIPKGETRGPELIPSKDMLSDLMFYCLIGIIFGGRIGYLALYDPKTFLTPVDIIKVWEGGMSFHGGFLGVCLAVFYMHWRKKISLWRVADMAAIGAPIGLGAVRLLGNFLNQELYGRETDVPWAFRFYQESANGEITYLNPRHPSQLYEAFLEGLMIWLILRIMSTRYKALTKPGLCAGVFIFLYGIFRFSIEFVREPDKLTDEYGRYVYTAAGEPVFDLLFGITRGMAYSIPMILVGLAVIIWAKRRLPVDPLRPAEPVANEPA